MKERTTAITPEVKAIGEINFSGNIIPPSWFDFIVFENGKPDLAAIMILSEIVWWYRPNEVRDKDSKKLIGYEKKFDSDLWQCGYNQLADRFGLTKRQVFRACENLKKHGIIKTHRRTVITKKKVRLGNVLFIEPIVSKILEITHPEIQASTLERTSLIHPNVQALCVPECNPNTSECITNTKNTVLKKTIQRGEAPKNGASSRPSSVKTEKPEPSKVEKLIGYWYHCKGESWNGLPPEKVEGKPFTHYLTERLKDEPDKELAWKIFCERIKCYWHVIKTPGHYYTYRGNITWFFAKGMDKFMNPKEAYENFKDDKKNGRAAQPEKQVIAPWQKRWNPLEQKGLVQDAATTT